jgi:opacity protein-like surface antigen
MKNTLLITTSIVALIAGANLASAQRVEDTHGAPAAATSSEQKAPEGKMKEQDATKHQKSDTAKPTSHAQVPDARTPGRASDSKSVTGQGTAATPKSVTGQGAADKTSQKEESQLPSKGAAQSTGQGQSKSVSAPLSSEQHVRIRNMLRGEKTERLATGGFSISIGEAIPRTVHLYRLPLQLVESFPEYRDYEYIMVGEEILIVNPRTLEIIAVIPA